MQAPDQEAENVANQVLHLMTQRGKDAENWQRQSKDWEAKCKGLREEVGAAYAAHRLAERRVGELRMAARTVVLSMSRPIGYEGVTLVDTAALRALARCVSQKEETRA